MHLQVEMESAESIQEKGTKQEEANLTEQVWFIMLCNAVAIIIAIGNDFTLYMVGGMWTKGIIGLPRLYAFIFLLGWPNELFWCNKMWCLAKCNI